MRHNSYLYSRRGDEFYYAQHKPSARLTRTASATDIGPQMCARYSLTKEQITMLIGEIEVIINLGARYNIAPTQIVPAIWLGVMSHQVHPFWIGHLTTAAARPPHARLRLVSRP